MSWVLFFLRVKRTAIGLPSLPGRNQPFHHTPPPPITRRENIHPYLSRPRVGSAPGKAQRPPVRVRSHCVPLAWVWYKYSSTARRTPRYFIGKQQCYRAYVTWAAHGLEVRTRYISSCCGNGYRQDTIHAATTAVTTVCKRGVCERKNTMYVPPVPRVPTHLALFS